MPYLIVIVLSIFTLTGCQSAYYSAMEQVGYHKRDIMVDRVEDAKESQQDAQEEFTSALEALSSLTNFSGGDLEDMYNQINDKYQDSEKARKRHKMSAIALLRLKTCQMRCLQSGRAN